MIAIGEMSGTMWDLNDDPVERSPSGSSHGWLMGTRLAGAPQVAGAGVDLLHKIGDRVASREPLYRIHADTASDLQFAREVATRASGFAIGEAGTEATTEFAAEF